MTILERIVLTIMSLIVSFISGMYGYRLACWWDRRKKQ